MAKKTELGFIENGLINFEKYNKLFERINECTRTKKELEEIAEDYKINLDSIKYPRLNFKIKESEIKEIKALINFKDEVLLINQDELNPISKLLFSLVWKQGDLQKLKLIIKGIEEAEKPDFEKPDRLVFYCFGNHLANPEKYPIIDQHVVRALNLKNDNSKCNSIRKSDKVTPEDRANYLEWFEKFNNVDSDFLYLLDRILFEVGKAVKLKNTKNS